MEHTKHHHHDAEVSGPQAGHGVPDMMPGMFSSNCLSLIVHSKLLGMAKICEDKGCAAVP
jgi:hypothetical protein